MIADLDKQILEAMKRGMSRAGFVNVRELGVRPMNYGHTDVYGVEGDCPCGLGTSRFARAVNRVEREYIDAHELEGIELRVYHGGLKHIEKDRAEGRWEDTGAVAVAQR